ncbi:unnamed protein product, partial [Haemonchus placei]|uniref:Zinc transporter 2 n=1 Tax=Haemonchus placei TaxID=6290 RepID=A0A0N4XA03_HAEPC
NVGYNSIQDDNIQFHCHDEPSNDNSRKSAEGITSLRPMGLPKKRAKLDFLAKRILWISLGICLFFMICEVVGGVWAKSLAIVTDAAHLLTDFASMLISLFSVYIASKPPSQRMSFGFHRAEVLGAFFSVFLIWIVTGVLVVLAILRILNADYEIDATIMAITAGIGVFVNLIMGALLFFGGHAHSHGGGGHSHGKHSGSPNINVRAAFIHVLGDLVQSVGVLVAALIIFFNESWAIVDPICTLLFSVIVLCTTIYILRDALVVLLEGRPSNIDFSRVFSSLEKIEGVKKVHDLRIWALTMDKVAVSVHLEVAQPQNAQSVLRDTRTMLNRESWAIVDPICTLLFSVIVLCTTIYILRDALVVLLEGESSESSILYIMI